MERTELGDGSYIDVLRGLVREPDELFTSVREQVEWRQNRALREGKWIDDPRLMGSFPDRSVPAARIVRHVGLVIGARYRADFKGYGLILYRDGRDSIGFHRDRGLRFLEDTVSAGLSLGGTRPFCLRPRFGGDPLSFMLGPGDAYVMGGRCQMDWMHGVPKVDHADPKISAIWRWTSGRGRPTARHEWAPKDF